MLVKNIIKKSAEFLKLKDVIEWLENDEKMSDDVSEIINDMMLAVNMVNTNIASSYIELIDEKDLNVSFGKNISFSNISSHPIIEIKSIKNVDGDDVKFKIFPSGLVIYASGKVNIEYTYFPNELNLSDSIDYYLKMNELTFAIGVVGEYLYLNGALDEASIWEKRFKNNLFNLVRPKKNIVLPQRRDY